MKRIVSDYISILENIGTTINNSPFKTSYIVDRLGMKANTFHTKVRNKNFTPYELMELMQIIDIEEKPRISDKEQILKSLEQARNGETISHEEVMAEAYEGL